MVERQTRSVYIFGDGDRVRERIDELLLGNRLEELRVLSQDLSEAISFMADQFRERMKGEILMSAGDDLLVCVPVESYSRERLVELADKYKVRTGGSISFGVGATVESAYLNLRRAKSSNSEKVVETGVLS